MRMALQLLPLVFTRPGELRLARWNEFKLDKAKWTIPATRTKTREVLHVHLTRQALNILHELHKVTDSTEGYLFPAPRDKSGPISDNTLNKALRKMGYSKEKMTLHGWRAIARTKIRKKVRVTDDNGAKVKIEVDAMELQLGHAVRDSNGDAYNRTDLLDERAAMLIAWAQGHANAG